MPPFWPGKRFGWKNAAFLSTLSVLGAPRFSGLVYAWPREEVHPIPTSPLEAVGQVPTLVEPLTELPFASHGPGKMLYSRVAVLFS